MITKLVINKIKRKKTRLILTILGIGFTLALFISFNSLADSMIRSGFSHVETVNYDYLVKASDNTQGFGGLPLGKDKLNLVQEVKNAEIYPVIQMKGAINYKNKTIPVVLSSFDVTRSAVQSIDTIDGAIFPWDKAPGVIVDRSIVMQTEDIKVGSQITIGNHKFEVMGLTENHMLYYPVVYIPHKLMEMASKGEVSYGLVKVGSYGDRKLIRKALSSINGVTVQSKREVLQEYLDEMSFMSHALLVLEVLIIGIGMLILCITIYTATTEQLHNLGIIKALGASDNYLIAYTIIDATMIVLASAVIGFIGWYGIYLLASKYLPIVGSQIDYFLLVRFILLSLFMVNLGVILALGKIRSLDPVTVIKEIS